MTFLKRQIHVAVMCLISAAVLLGFSAPANAVTVWQPAAHTEWQWYLAGLLNTSNATQMGTGKVAYDGTTAPASDPQMYDIDGIINTATVVSQLHAKGKSAVCYIEVGTAGDYYSTAEEGISTTYYTQFKNAGVLGKQLSGYPEYFLNINASATVTIVENMIREQCANKGFDGVETDLDETFGGNEGATGFTITQTQEQNYLITLSDYMHSLGLGWIAKNLDDTGIQSFVTAMEPHSQGVISEECNQYSTCSLLAPYATSNKPVFNAEYALGVAKFCPKDNAKPNFNGVKFSVDLNGSRNPCR